VRRFNIAGQALGQVSLDAIGAEPDRTTELDAAELGAMRVDEPLAHAEPRGDLIDRQEGDAGVYGLPPLAR